MDINAVNFYQGLEKVVSEVQKTPDGTFQELLVEITGGRMAEEIRENYHVTLDVGNIGNYQELINSGAVRCTNYVRISPRTLMKMEKNPALKQKVLSAIEEFCSQESQAEIRALQPPVKSAGMLIYPDGSTLYWLEGYPNEAEGRKGEKSTSAVRLLHEEDFRLFLDAGMHELSESIEILDVIGSADWKFPIGPRRRSIVK